MMKAIKEYVFDKTISSIDEYVSQSETISLIKEYLLSKKNKHAKTADEAKYNDLVQKLYNKFGKYHSGFKKLLTDGTFTYYAYTDNEIKETFPQEVIDLANVEPDKNGSGTYYKWNVLDILDLYDYDYAQVYELVCKWYNW